jgi:hypothetical protein
VSGGFVVFCIAEVFVKSGRVNCCDGMNKEALRSVLLAVCVPRRDVKTLNEKDCVTGVS